MSKAKPKKHELAGIDYFSEYDSFPIYDANGEQANEHIRLFRSTDEELFMERGFNKKAISEKLVQIKTSDGYTMEHWQSRS
ncbi:MAG: hypothetical protein Q4B75_09790 [Eubacteriales bacterium]|nr:hypothetical protein [Eubacteriales bacterium]